MNIVFYEFIKYLRSLWIWILSIIVQLLVFMAFYPVLAEDAAILDLFLEHYPEELLKAFGMGGELSLATVAGYFAFSFALVQLILAVQSAYYGFHFMSVEERELTADFLYSKPVSRWRIMLAKYSAAMMALLLTNAGVWAGTFTALEWFRGDNAYELWPIISLLLTVPVFQMLFFSIGFLVTALTRKMPGVIGPSVGVALVLYIPNALRRIVGGELLGFISPYYHFDPNYILRAGQWDPALSALSVSIAIAANIAALILFLRRDIRSAV
jgi:ABC-2 type transport system permease protein